MQPQTQRDKLHYEPFIADISCFIGYAATVYDKAYKKVVDKKALQNDLYKFRGVKIEQGVNNLDKCKDDIDLIRKCLAKYGIIDMGRNDSYLLDDTPTYNRVFKVRTSIKKRIKKTPDNTFVLVFALAGHGMQMDGRQIVLINQYDKKTRFYKLWSIEADIRGMAKNNTNAYVIGLFACCREIFNNQKHCNLFGGTQQQACVHFDRAGFVELQAEVAKDAAKAEAQRTLGLKLRENSEQFISIEKWKEEELGK